MKLQGSRVYRGGATAPNWYGSTTDVSGKASQLPGEAFRFNFEIPSKGGGTTQLALVLGMKDLAALLNELAVARPQSAAMLTESAHLAVAELVGAGQDKAKAA